MEFCFLAKIFGNLEKLKYLRDEIIKQLCQSLGILLKEELSSFK